MSASLRHQVLAVGLGATLVEAAAAVSLDVRFGPGEFFNSDASIYQVVARHPFAAHAIPADIGLAFGNAYRYGRILYPLLAWILGAGQPHLVRFAMVAINVAALGAAAAAAATLCLRAGRPAAWGLAVLLAPGVLVGVALAVTEPLTLALVLAAYVLAQDDRRRWVLVAAALVALTREAAVVALIPLAWRDIRRAPSRATGWLVTLVPLAGWWTWVRWRIGTWPPLDPSPVRRRALALPLTGYVEVARHGLDGDRVATFALAALTLGLAAVAWRWRPRAAWPVGAGAVAAAAVLVCLGPEAVRIPGEFLRVMSLPQGLVAVALVTRPAWSSPGGAARETGAGAIARSGSRGAPAEAGRLRTPRRRRT